MIEKEIIIGENTKHRSLAKVHKVMDIGNSTKYVLYEHNHERYKFTYEGLYINF